MIKSKAKILVALVVMVSLGLASCGGSRPASSVTAEDLTGVWKKDTSFTMHVQLNQDGTYQIRSTVDSKSPYEVGQFQLDGALLTFVPGDDSVSCKNWSGSYQVELTEQGQLHFELQEDECPSRANLQPGFYYRVEP